MSIPNKRKIPIGMVVFLVFLTIFMFRFVKVILDKDVAGNLSYVQLLNSGMPLVEATYYDEDAYVESDVTLKSLVLETLNIKKIDPIELAVKQIPYFGSLATVNKVEKPNYLPSIKDLVSFDLKDDSIAKIPKDEIAISKTEGVYDPSLKQTLDQSKPRILLYHTHTTEGYSVSNSTDENMNVVGVGDYLTKELEENYGISVIHDKTMHSASYNDSYKRSRETVQKYVNKYGQFDMVIDLHRDSHSNKNLVTANINGEDVARIMFVLTRNNPYYQDSFKLASSLKSTADRLFPGLVIPARDDGYYIYNRGQSMFNQDLSKNSALIEVGADCNTPQEAMNTAKYIARLIAEQLNRK